MGQGESESVPRSVDSTGDGATQPGGVSERRLLRGLPEVVRRPSSRPSPSLGTREGRSHDWPGTPVAIRRLKGSSMISQTAVAYSVRCGLVSAYQGGRNRSSGAETALPSHDFSGGGSSRCR